MDFSKLATVTDSLIGNKPQKVSAQPVEVEDNNPLDKLVATPRIADKRNMFILDAQGIKQLAEMPRDKRRSFLSRCTDSQRRRVLTQLRKIKDAGFSEKLGYKLLDDLLANAVFDPSDYNIKTLNQFVDTQEYFEMDEEVSSIISAIRDGSFDATQFADAVAHFAELCDGNSRLVQVASTQEEAIDEVPEDDPEEPVEDPVEEPEDEGFEEEDFEEFAPEEPTDEVYDSIRRRAKLDAARAFKRKTNVSVLVDSADRHISHFVTRGYDFTKVSDSYWSEFDKAYNEQFKEISEFETHSEDEEEFKNRYGVSWREALHNEKVADAIKDTLQVIKDAEDALDKMHDNPYIDEQGNEHTDVEETPIVQLLSEALLQYADGNTEKLDVLVNTTIAEGEKPEEEPEDESDDAEEKDSEDSEDNESEEEESEDDADQLEDSVHTFAQLIKNGSTDNKLVDSLKPYVPALRKINFRVTDCDMPYLAECPQAIAPCPPLTHDEYQTIFPPMVPEYVMPLIQATYECPEPLPFDTYDLTGNCLTCNTAVGPQTYQAICPAEELQNELEQAEKENWPHIVGSRCCTVDSVMNMLARLNLLSCCDSRFYRCNVADAAWSFDEVPAVLAKQGIADSGKIVFGNHGGKQVSIYGVTYSVL